MNAPALLDLNLNHNRLGAQAIEYLSHAKWPNLKNILLGNNPLGNVGVREFSRC